MTKIRINLIKARENIYPDFSQTLNESNRIWYSVTRLVITLSSSFLLLTLAFVEKLFPTVNELINLPKSLIFAWIFLFLAIVLGIINEIDASIFHGNLAKDKSRVLREIDIKISQGLTEDIIDLAEDYTIDAPFWYGALSIQSFIIAILCMCLAFSNHLISGAVQIGVFIIGILSIGALTRYLLNKRS